MIMMNSYHAFCCVYHGQGVAGYEKEKNVTSGMISILFTVFEWTNVSITLLFMIM